VCADTNGESDAREYKATHLGEVSRLDESGETHENLVVSKSDRHAEVLTGAAQISRILRDSHIEPNRDVDLAS